MEATIESAEEEGLWVLFQPTNQKQAWFEHTSAIFYSGAGAYP